MTIPVKATEHYFSVVLFILSVILHKVVSTQAILKSSTFLWYTVFVSVAVKNVVINVYFGSTYLLSWSRYKKLDS